MADNGIHPPAAFFQRLQVGVVGHALRPRGTEEVIGHDVDTVQARFQQRIDVGVAERLDHRRAGNGDFDVAQACGVQLLTQFANQQGVVLAVFRAVRVASAFGVRIFPVNVHFAEHRELLEQFYHAFGKDLTRGVRRGSFMETVTHTPAADAHGQHQVVALLLRFGLQIAQAAEQALSITLGHGLRIDIPAADGMANVNVRLEVAPRVEEGGLVLHFSALIGTFGNHVAPQVVYFVEAGHADETDDDFVVGGRRNVGQVVAATAVIF
ncbi:Uncharacterised protein [Klebsiella michiganensis]|nr:Uncharacterised protein [Klebsiella michiganensis]